MPVIVKYICDKCAAEHPDNGRMWNVKVSHAPMDGSTRYDPWTSKQQMWCRPCMVAAGLLHTMTVSKPGEPEPAKAPTFEDLVREIAADVVLQATGGSP